MAGSRCKRKTVIGVPWCYQHLASEMSLKIQASTIEDAGKGLFAISKTKEIVFRKGQTIIEYQGEKITHHELEKRYGNKTGPYAITTTQDQIIDAACERSVGAIANHKASRHANAKFFTQNKSIILQAIKQIKNGDEIFVNYGPDFELGDKRVKFMTT